MATAQEILQKIKENKRKENEKLFKLAASSSSRNCNTSYMATASTVSISRLNTVNYTYEQEYKLYLNLVVYYILHPSIILPLYPYQKMLQKIVPKVYNNIYGNVTYYCMVGLNKQLLNTVVMLSKNIDELNKVISTLLASVPTNTLDDINFLLQERKYL